MVRIKNRYIILEVVPENPPKEFKPLKIKQDVLYRTVKNKILKDYGLHGMGNCREGLLVKYCNEELGIFVVRVRHGPHSFVQNCFPLKTRINNKNISLEIIYIGGTIRSSLKFLKKYQEKRLVEDLQKIKGDINYEKLYKQLMERTERSERNPMRII